MAFLDRDSVMLIFKKMTAHKFYELTGRHTHIRFGYFLNQLFKSQIFKLTSTSKGITSAVTLI